MSSTSLPTRVQGDGEQALGSVHNSSSLPLLPPHTFPLLHRGLIQGLQGKPCSGTWSPSSPPSSLTLVSAGLLLSHSALTAHCLCSVLLFLKYIFPKMPPPWLRGSARPCRGVGWSWLEPSVSGTGQPWPLLTEATPAVPRCQHLGTRTWYRMT